MNDQLRAVAKPRLLSRESVGMFQPRPWLDEGDRLLTVAEVNRDSFRRLRRRFSQKIRSSSTKSEDRARLWNEIEGTARASWLLLGYAVEMYLKSGLAKAYAGCRELVFLCDVKSKFSHDLLAIANEIGFPATPHDQEPLSALKGTLQVARYPPDGNDGGDYAEKVNARTSSEWNDQKFQTFIDIAKRIRAHVVRIDSDSKNPALKKSVRVDSDGYVAFRTGGHLPTRITYRFSSEQNKAGQTELEDMIDLLKENDSLHLINQSWTIATIYEDKDIAHGNARTKRRVLAG